MNGLIIRYEDAAFLRCVLEEDIVGRFLGEDIDSPNDVPPPAGEAF